MLTESKNKSETVNSVLVNGPYSVVQEGWAHQQSDAEEFQIVVDVLFSGSQTFWVQNYHVDYFVILIVGN